MSIAEEALQLGPGYAQEGFVLAEAAKKLGVRQNLSAEQDILTEWQNLFREGNLAWGYNLDNPSAPFFHKP